jgi:hypothetical protein
MPRKKLPNPAHLLSRPIIIRLTEKQFEHLQELQKKSDCSTMGELVRRILTNRKIKIFTIDVSMDGPMEEMALIRKELKSIGVNINQITRSFNQDKTGTNRGYYITKNSDLYRQVDLRVERLISLISNLALKWLQK